MEEIRTTTSLAALDLVLPHEHSITLAVARFTLHHPLEHLVSEGFVIISVYFDDKGSRLGLIGIVFLPLDLNKRTVFVSALSCAHTSFAPAALLRMPGHSRNREHSEVQGKLWLAQGAVVVLLDVAVLHLARQVLLLEAVHSLGFRVSCLLRCSR